MTYISEGLIEVLLEMAQEADPQEVIVRLAVTPVSELDLDGDLDPEAHVFTDFYLPSTGDSIQAVFGMDVSHPPGQTPGIFISHPDGHLGLRQQDEFAERVIVAIPPWGLDDVRVFDRRGREHVLELVEVV